jgi:hypothetical protein
VATLAELLRDPQFRRDVGDNASDFLKSANNAVASGVTAPVDGLAWLLRKAGANVGNAPWGSSDWANNVGLTGTPQNKNSLASLLGEAGGNIAPFAIGAKAPQIAGGLLKAGDNLAAPAVNNKQLGAVRIEPFRNALKTEQKFHNKAISDEASRLQNEWATTGDFSNEIFNKIPKSHFDSDGDLLQSGSDLFQKLQVN